MHSPAHELGDYIGGESCVNYIKPDEADYNAISSHGAAAAAAVTNIRSRIRVVSAAEKEYPPLIPWLARHEMKRYSTSDGRLVITEERVGRHEYLETHRSNGRLVINLVAFSDDEDDDGEGEEEEFENVAEEEISGGDERPIGDLTAEEVAVPDYYKYSGVGNVNPCGGCEATAAATAVAFRPRLHT